MRRLWGVPALAGLLILVSGCGSDTPIDPHAQEESDLAWAQMQADAQRLEILKTAALILLLVLAVVLVVAVAIRLGAWARRGVVLSDFIYPNAQGLLPFRARELNHPALAATALGAFHQGQYRLAESSQAVPHTYHYQVQGVPGPLPLPEARAPLQLPAAPLLTVESLLSEGWRPQAGGILLAMTPGGPLTVPVGEKLCHGAMLGTTGGGKTMTFMWLMAQLQAVGAQTIWLNHKYTPRHPDTDFDFATLATHTTLGRVVMDRDEGLARLRYLKKVELPRRRALFNAGKHAEMGPPQYWFVGEALGLVARDREIQRARPPQERDPDIMTDMGEVYREGRELGYFLFTELQDALVKSMGGSVGLQGQINTVFYVGGDPLCAERFFKVSVPEPPGRGGVFLKCYGQTAPVAAQVPLLTNAALYRVLGESGSRPQWRGATIVDVPMPAPDPPPVVLPWDSATYAHAAPLPWDAPPAVPSEPSEAGEASAAGPDVQAWIAARQANEVSPASPYNADQDTVAEPAARWLMRQQTGIADVYRIVWGAERGERVQEAAKKLRGWYSTWV